MIPARLPVVLVSFLLTALLRGATPVVNCVGDSITAGVGVPTAAVESYPARLQQLAGTNFLVANDGYSGATLLTNGDTPYVNQSAFAGSKKFSPFAIVILLGSNDSKPQNWVYGTNFYSNYVNLIAAYTNLASHPRVLICTPPPAFSNNIAINPGIVATNISPIIRQLGADLGLSVIDMQTLLAGHSGWFPDGVHPNVQGADVMAAIVYTALQGDTMNGAIPALAIKPPANKNVVLKWPAGGAGWVLQSTPALGGTNTWLIASNSVAIGNDGANLLFTNSAASPNMLFRLWNPLN